MFTRPAFYRTENGLPTRQFDAPPDERWRLRRQRRSSGRQYREVRAHGRRAAARSAYGKSSICWRPLLEGRMKDVVVIGAGKIGATIAGLLASTSDYQVTLADRSPEVLGRLDREERIRIAAA